MRVLVTGSAGFIGFHVARLLLGEGHAVLGYDAMSAQTDVALKRRRHAALEPYPAFRAVEALLEDDARLDAEAEAFGPDVIVHLAAQAGVRYSIANPRAYLDANVTGTFNVLETARKVGVRHLMIASTSSVYGANTAMPYRETDRADTPMSFYAATKKSCEAMAHAQSHIHALPVTLFRFFTVYGPWGRPDLAPYLFTDAILAGRAIDVFNGGEMYRDFTYVGDLVRAVRLLIDVVPQAPGAREGEGVAGDSLSPVAPCRVVNIGNSTKVRLTDFIAAIEAALGMKAVRRDLPMQPGDVPATWADAGLLEALTGYRPRTELADGVAKFVEWFRAYTGR